MGWDLVVELKEGIRKIHGHLLGKVEEESIPCRENSMCNAMCWL